MFIDLMYPDNENRLHRLEQLSMDCSNLSASISEDKERIERKVKEANQIIAAAYSKISTSPIPYHKADITNDFVIEVAEVISGLFSFPAAIVGFNYAYTAWLLKQGRIGEAALLKLLKLPGWVKVGRTGVAIIFTFGIEAVVDSISGAIQRDQMRKGIHELIQPRILSKRNAMINDRAFQALQSIIDAYNVFLELGIYTQEQLDEVARKLVEKHKHDVDSYTEQEAKRLLEIFDKDRQAWTKEDY